LFDFDAIPSLPEVCGGSRSLRDTPQRPRIIFTPQAERKAHTALRETTRAYQKCSRVRTRASQDDHENCKAGASVSVHSINAQVAAWVNSNAGKSILQLTKASRS
jgi:hypothetical protein